jgi:hypothetical protein
VAVVEPLGVRKFSGIPDKGFPSIAPSRVDDCLRFNE